MNNYGFDNENDYMNFFKDRIEHGITNFVFKGANGTIKVYNNIIGVSKVIHSTRRSMGKCNKGDILLHCSTGEYIPISIKMSGTRTSWESADSSLKHILKEFIKCYGRINIPGSMSVKVIDHGINLDNYVFGHDIIDNNGTILVQTLKTTIQEEYNEDTIVLNCYRVFNNIDDINIDDRFKPVIGVRKDSSRNKKDDLIRGYRIEVIPQYVSTEISNILEYI